MYHLMLDLFICVFPHRPIESYITFSVKTLIFQSLELQRTDESQVHIPPSAPRFFILSFRLPLQ